MSFIVLGDHNFILRAFNLDHVKTVTLADAGRTSLQPTVAIVMADGDTFDHLRIPVPDEVRDSLNARWTQEQLTKAINDFFDVLRNVIP